MEAASFHLREHHDGSRVPALIAASNSAAGTLATYLR